MKISNFLCLGLLSVVISCNPLGKQESDSPTSSVSVEASSPTLSYDGSTTSSSVGVAISVAPTTLNDNGAEITNCVISPSLPLGLSINSSTCVISGTPAISLLSTNYSIVVTNSVGSSTATVTLYVAPCSSAEISAIPFAGEGSVNNPYRICSMAQLNSVRDHTAGHFELRGDIDASGTTFTPIPNFKGEFDGKGHTISNLTISSPSSNFVGFFAKLSGATVKNLILTNLNVSGSSYVGGLAGRIGPASLVSRVSTSGTVRATGEYSGGLAGRAQYARVLQSKSSAAVMGASLTGGLLGSCSQFCQVSQAFASGAVTGTSLVGGLIGDLEVGSKVDHVFAQGVVNSDSQKLLIERASMDPEQTTYSLAALVENAFFDSEISGASDFGVGVTGSNPGSSFSSWDSTIWVLSDSAFPRLKYFEASLTYQEITEPALTPLLCSNSAAFDGGHGTRSSPFLISTAAQMQNVHCNPQASFRLTADIDMAGMSYSRPLNYSGQFDGAGHTISNLLIPRIEGVWKTGLFDSLMGGIVKDLSVLNANVTGNYSVGVIAGHAEKGAVVLRCRTSGAVTALGGAIATSEGETDWGAGGSGGVVGSMWHSLVAESASSVTVSADHRSGGLIGQGEPQAMIWDSYATGTVSCETFCGGLAGVMAHGSTGAYNFVLGTGPLIGYGDEIPDSYVNPNSNQTANWDPGIWDTTSSTYPLIRGLSAN